MVIVAAILFSVVTRSGDITSNMIFGVKLNETSKCTVTFSDLLQCNVKFGDMFCFKLTLRCDKRQAILKMASLKAQKLFEFIKYYQPGDLVNHLDPVNLSTMSTCRRVDRDDIVNLSTLSTCRPCQPVNLISLKTLLNCCCF